MWKCECGVRNGAICCRLSDRLVGRLRPAGSWLPRVSESSQVVRCPIDGGFALSDWVWAGVEQMICSTAVRLLSRGQGQSR